MSPVTAGGLLVYGDHVDDQPVAGIAYQSRHGNDVTLWAVFERPVMDLGHNHRRARRPRP